MGRGKARRSLEALASDINKTPSGRPVARVARERHSGSKSLPLDIGKARRQLEELAESQGCADKAAEAAFIILSGALNPVHKAHVVALEEARKAIEAHAGMPVFAGFLAPSSDSYVQGKLGDEALPNEERSHLCELACTESDWIDVCPWGWASSARVTHEVGQQLARRLAWTGYCNWQLVGWQVAGADFAVRASLWRKSTPTVCLARGDEDTALVRAEAPAYSSHFILVDATGLEDVSSTAIRAMAAADEWDKLSASGWLAPAVLHRLRKGHRASLEPGEGDSSIA